MPTVAMLRGSAHFAVLRAQAASKAAMGEIDFLKKEQSRIQAKQKDLTRELGAIERKLAEQEKGVLEIAKEPVSAPRTSPSLPPVPTAKTAPSGGGVEAMIKDFASKREQITQELKDIDVILHNISELLTHGRNAQRVLLKAIELEGNFVDSLELKGEADVAEIITFLKIQSACAYVHKSYGDIVLGTYNHSSSVALVFLSSDHAISANSRLREALEKPERSVRTVAPIMALGATIGAWPSIIIIIGIGSSLTLLPIPVALGYAAAIVFGGSLLGTIFATPRAWSAGRPRSSFSKIAQEALDDFSNDLTPQEKEVQDALYEHEELADKARKGDDESIRLLVASQEHINAAVDTLPILRQLGTQYRFYEDTHDVAIADARANAEKIKTKVEAHTVGALASKVELAQGDLEKFSEAHQDLVAMCIHCTNQEFGDFNKQEIGADVKDEIQVKLAHARECQQEALNTEGGLHPYQVRISALKVAKACAEARLLMTRALIIDRSIPGNSLFIFKRENAVRLEAEALEKVEKEFAKMMQRGVEVVSSTQRMQRGLGEPSPKRPDETAEQEERLRAGGLFAPTPAPTPTEAQDKTPKGPPK